MSTYNTIVTDCSHMTNQTFIHRTENLHNVEIGPFFHPLFFTPYEQSNVIKMYTLYDRFEYDKSIQSGTLIVLITIE